ncbi:unnamed protein product [Closterium sp. NIES-53]
MIDWIRGARRQLSESFSSDLPVLRLHSDRGGEFSSDLLRAFCRLEGIRQTFKLLASPQQNGIAERRIGMVMDFAGLARVVVLPTKLLRGTDLQEAAEEEGEGEAEAVGEALAEGESEVTTMRGMGALVAGGAPEWRVRAGTARRLDTLGSSVSAGLRDGRLQA